VVKFGEIKLIVEMELIRRTPGGDELSREMTEILALVIYDEYELFPTNPDRDRFSQRGPHAYD
jgi:hypothetical protein